MLAAKKTGGNRHVETYDPGYDGEIRSVRVPASAWDIAANLLLPPGFDAAGRYPAVVCGHPIGGGKEQTAGNIYGAALAKEAYVAIAFDAPTVKRRSPRFWIGPPPSRPDTSEPRRFGVGPVRTVTLRGCAGDSRSSGAQALVYG